MGREQVPLSPNVVQTFDQPDVPRREALPQITCPILLITGDPAKGLVTPEDAQQMAGLWHVDYFRCHITERGRSPLVEEYDDPETVAENALLVLASAEKEDGAAPEMVAERAAAEIAAHAANLKVQTIVLYPFAHLFGQLSRPATAVLVLHMVEQGLLARELAVTRTPFGWFNTLEIRAKGHPLSRVARTISAEETNL